MAQFTRQRPLNDNEFCYNCSSSYYEQLSQVILFFTCCYLREDSGECTSYKCNNIVVYDGNTIAVAIFFEKYPLWFWSEKTYQRKTAACLLPTGKTDWERHSARI